MVAREKEWQVYTLSDPRDGMVRYVGVSRDTDARYKRHLWDARTGKGSQKCNWLRSLPHGMEPIFAIVESGRGRDWPEAERKWIEFYRERGDRLTNSIAAGTGAPAGFKMPPRTPEHTARHAAALRGKKLSAEHRAKLSEVRKGRKFSAEIRAKISASQKGRMLSPEQRAHLSAVLRGRKKPPRSAEHRANLSTAVKGQKRSPEQCARNSEAQLRAAALRPKCACGVCATCERRARAERAKLRVQP